MSNRKTIEVKTVKEIANNVLQRSAPEMARERLATANFIERILLDTGNYKGFQYLPSELNEEGRLREGYDHTRRRYY